MLLDDLWQAQDQFRKRQDGDSLHSVIDLSVKHFDRAELLQLNNRAKNDPTLLAQLRSKIENLETTTAVDAMIKKEILGMIDAFLRSTSSR
jgi:hypothetical protein